MNNFVPLAALDVWSLAASLRSRMNLFDNGELLAYNESHELVVDKWPQLHNVLGRAHRLDPAAELGRVRFELLAHEGYIPWTAYSLEWRRLHLPIVTNPGAWMYSGPQSAHIEAGVLTWVNTAVLCSEVNFGEFPRIHLVLEVRSKGE